MKVYYIDDSFFHDSSFSKEMLGRFMNKIDHVGKGIILISSTHEYTDEIHRFQEEVSSNIVVLESPAVFDIDGIRGNLRNSFLILEDFESTHTYSGSCVEYDLQQHTCQRIYFEMFPKHDHLTDFDLFVEHLEEVLNDKAKGFKKKKDSIS